MNTDGQKRMVVDSADTLVTQETNRVIRKIMETLEVYTNVRDLPEKEKSIVRDTVLNQVNKLARVVKHKQIMVFTTSQGA